MAEPGPPETYRFQDFELDVPAYVLRRSGLPVKLERQPMDLLILLVERRNQLVSRSDIVECLWGKDVFIEVETGINTAVRKIRHVLGDPSEAPTLVETVPGKGYRFIAPVEVVPGSRRAPASPELPAGMPAAAGKVPDDAPPPARTRRVRVVTGVAAVALLAGLAAWMWRGADAVIIAVLPFENISGIAEQDYLVAGLTEETIATLGQIDPERMQVVGRTSMMEYKRTAKSLATIGRELGADYLVESSVRAEGAHLRITAKLIRVRDQVQVWSDSYNRELGSLLSLQQELSQAIAEQVRLRLSPDQLEVLTRRQTRNPEAYDLYLRGLSVAHLRTPPANERAIEYFQRATTLDPDYALAWAALADVYAVSPLNGDAEPLDVRPRVQAAVAQALRARPNLPETQDVLGMENWFFDWDWPGAEATFRRAVVLDSKAGPHVSLGHVLSQMGRYAEAQVETRRGVELDPRNPMGYAMSSQVAFQGRDYSPAVEHASKAIELTHGRFWIGHMMLAQAYEQQGQNDKALESLTTAAPFSGNNSKVLSLRGYVLAKVGRQNEARELLATLETVSRQRYVPPYAFALIHAALGERDAVFEWLDRAEAARDVHLIFLPVDAKWDPYRADPRFVALLARCNFMRTAPSAALTQ
jgi:TolB-like protein/DNA-binding winged helix-turn-helix (wHTH) protein